VLKTQICVTRPQCVKNMYWSAENSLLIHKVPTHDGEVGVWCAMRADVIIGHFFLD